MRIEKAQGQGGSMGQGGRMSKSVILKLMQILRANNPYAKVFMSARQVLAGNQAATFKLKGAPRPGCDPKRYNQPSVDEVAAIVSGPGEIMAEREILLHRSNGKLQPISDMHSAYFPLRYPMFYPFGEQKWDGLCCVSTNQSG